MSYKNCVLAELISNDTLTPKNHLIFVMTKNIWSSINVYGDTMACRHISSPHFFDFVVIAIPLCSLWDLSYLVCLGHNIFFSHALYFHCSTYFKTKFWQSMPYSAMSELFCRWYDKLDQITDNIKEYRQQPLSETVDDT